MPDLRCCAIKYIQIYIHRDRVRGDGERERERVKYNDYKTVETDLPIVDPMDGRPGFTYLRLTPRVLMECGK
jgi:hypothetical protein